MISESRRQALLFPQRRSAVRILVKDWDGKPVKNMKVPRWFLNGTNPPANRRKS